nr:hypothetical protein [Mycobacterium sp. E3298]
MEQDTYRVYGEIRIPLCFETKGASNQDVLQKTIEKFSRRSVLVLDGDLHMANGKSHPLLADSIYIQWFEATDKEDM